jgi:hypothetical protein
MADETKKVEAYGGLLTYGVIGAPEAQPDWTMSVDVRGLLEGNFKQYYPTLQKNTAAPQKGDPHPMDARLRCYKSSAQFTKMNGAYITADYIGLSKDPTEAEWEVTSATSETSIIFHPQFPLWTFSQFPTKENKYQFRYNEKYVETDPNDSLKFVRFKLSAPYGFGGVESYFVPRGTIRATFYTGKKSLVGDILGNLGKWRKTPLYVPEDVLPKAGDASWLLVNAGITEYGPVYKVQTEWMQSEHGQPWNIYIYSEYESTFKPRPL